MILTGTRNRRLAIGKELGADRVINIADENAVDVVKELTGGIGADYVVECAGTKPPSTRPFIWPIAAGKSASPHSRTTR